MQVVNEIKPDVKDLFGDKYVNAEYLRQFFGLKDRDGVYHRMKVWGIAGKKFGNGFKYWSLNKIKKELEK